MPSEMISWEGCCMLLHAASLLNPYFPNTCQSSQVQHVANLIVMWALMGDLETENDNLGIIPNAAQKPHSSASEGRSTVVFPGTPWYVICQRLFYYKLIVKSSRNVGNHRNSRVRDRKIAVLHLAHGNNIYGDSKGQTDRWVGRPHVVVYVDPMQSSKLLVVGRASLCTSSSLLVVYMIPSMTGVSTATVHFGLKIHTDRMTLRAKSNMEMLLVSQGGYPQV